MRIAGPLPADLAYAAAAESIDVFETVHADFKIDLPVVSSVFATLRPVPTRPRSDFLVIDQYKGGIGGVRRERVRSIHRRADVAGERQNPTIPRPEWIHSQRWILNPPVPGDF